MNQISALPNPLEILFQEYNQGRIESVGFRSFTLHAGESNSYRTLKSALIVPVSGRAIFSFEHEPFIAKRGLFLHGCPDKTLTISALGEQDFHYINMYYENDRPLLFSHKLKNPEQTFSILEQILKLHPDLSAWKDDKAPVEPHFDPGLGLLEDPLLRISSALWVRGGIPVQHPDGFTYEIRNRVTLCRCGHSSNKPFCDGTHASFKFRDGLPNRPDPNGEEY